MKTQEENVKKMRKKIIYWFYKHALMTLLYYNYFIEMKMYTKNHSSTVAKHHLIREIYIQAHNM